MTALREPSTSATPSPPPNGGLFRAQRVAGCKRTASGLSSAARLLAELQAVPGSRIIAKKLYADLEGFAAFLEAHGHSILAGVCALLKREADAGRRAGHYRSWPVVGHAVAGKRCCRQCHQVKPLADFARMGKDGPAITLCKRCDADNVNRRRAANLERARALERRRYWANLDQKRAVSRAKAASPRGREINRAAVKRYQERFPERNAARRLVKSAERRGALVRPAECQAEGCTAPARHAHHSNYDKPLCVDFLCHRHHEHCHHIGPVRLKPGAKRKFARAPRPDQSPIASAA